MLDINKIRADFPGLSQKLFGRDMIYLDNTATTQTPRQVVEAVTRGYYENKANVHRGVHTLSQQATALQEAARERVRAYINAASVSEMIFTRGTTEAINLVASSFGSNFEHGDEIILTVMEHHADIVPWQLLRSRTRVELKVVPVTADGSLDMDRYRDMFSERTRMVAFCHVSNVLGTVNPVKEMVAYAHSQGVPVLVDGAQAVPHIKVDVQDLDADFYCFSLHKMYGPTGVGVLYGKERLLEKMPPYQGGGEMISHVSFAGTTYAELPYKFEAGTPDFVGIGAITPALDYLDSLGMDHIAAHEHELLSHTMSRLTAEVDGIRIFGTAPGKCAVISFLLGDHHHYDTGMLLDKLGVEVRTGHHCAQPLMERLGVSGTVRASMAAYNTFEEADAFIGALRRIAPMLA